VRGSRRWDSASSTSRELAERALVDVDSRAREIAALHVRADRPSETDWRQIAALNDLLLRVLPTPVVELNRAVAVAMVDGPERGLLLLDALDARGDLRGYHLLPAARADLLRRLGRVDEAREAYRAAPPRSDAATRRPRRGYASRPGDRR
jgi:RNA polymerase sigma-70 factor, ECF subfamily